MPIKSTTAIVLALAIAGCASHRPAPAHPKEMNLLSKIGYVLQATAAGARGGSVGVSPAAPRTRARTSNAAPVVTPGTSALERWQPAALSDDPGHAIGSYPIASPALAQGGCRKAWVCDDHGQNCGVQDLCDSTTAIPSVGLAPLRPLPSVKLKPLPSTDLPPLGTTACEYRQVNGDWRNVCR